MAVKCLQLNCQRSYAVWGDLEAKAQGGGYDVIAVQEPPGGGNRPLPRLPGYLAILPAVGAPKVGVFVRSEHFVYRVDVDPHDWCVFALVDVGSWPVVIGSVYLSPSEEVGTKLAFLGDAIRGFRRDRLLVLCDANARSQLWYSRTGSNARGRLVERFVSRYDLHVLNRPGHLVTYCNTEGRGDSIDVSVGNLALVPYVSDWTVEDWSISDHRAILVVLSAPVRPRRGPGERRERVPRSDFASRLTELASAVEISGTAEEREGRSPG